VILDTSQRSLHSYLEKNASFSSKHRRISILSYHICLCCSDNHYTFRANEFPISNLNLVFFSGINDRRVSLFCGLRKFIKCNVSNGHRVNVNSNLYLPFHLTLSFRDFRNPAEQQPSNRAIFLMVTAQPVHSAYKGNMIQDLRRSLIGERIQ